MAKRIFLSAQERYERVMECRKSGLSDSAWCKENGIPQSTFYNWVVFLRNKGITEIDTVKPDAIVPQVQEVVKLDIFKESESVTEAIPALSGGHTAFTVSETFMSPVVEITLKGATIKFSNDIRPELLKMTLNTLGGVIC